MFQKDMTVSFLLDFYGDMLPERKREIISMYYNDDMSLAEIASEAGISRQGVRDSVKKTEKELYELEETLGLAAKFKAIKEETERIGKLVEECKNKTDSEEVTSLLSEISAALSSLDI